MAVFALVVLIAAGIGLLIEYCGCENQSCPCEDQSLEIKVREGWTLSEIAEGVGMTLEHIMELNGIEDPGLIYPGQKLKVEPYSDFNEVLVSWYGLKFHGKTMANGRKFNMNDSTIVAHKWLPFGTQVRLTWVKTGKSIIVVVQDRGPYIKERHFDLSYKAAEDLGMKEEGVAKCKVEIIS